MVNFLIRSFLKTFNKTIIKATDCAINVDIPIPFIPKAGINKNPNIKIGFKMILIRNDNIKTFLYVLVSPSACNNELTATTIINNIDPENIIFVY